MASTNYINECKNDAYKNRLGKIEVAEKKVTTGTSIKIEKSLEHQLELSLAGKTTQKSRVGYNILKNSGFSNDLSDWAVLKSGTTPEITTYNGKKCLHFKGSLGSRQHVSQSIEKRIAVGKTYTVTCMAFLKDFVAGTTNCFLSFYFDGKKTDGTWTGESFVSGAPAFNSKSYDYSKGTFIRTKYTFKIKEDTDLTKAFGFYIYARDFTGDLYVYDVQIAEGTEAKAWEDFGISPSTEFPSVIAGVGRENYFNKNASPKSYGVSTSVLDTGVRETITVAGNYKYCAFRLGGAELLGKTMTIGMTITPSASNTGLATIYFGNASSVSKQAVLNSSLSGTGNKSVTLNLPTSMPSDCTDINLLLYANGTGTGNVGDYVDYTNLIINEGRELKEYVPYEHTEIGFEINNANLWNDDLVINATKSTDGFTMTDKWAVPLLTQNNVLKTFKPNTTYTIKVVSKVLSKPTTLSPSQSRYDLLLYKSPPWTYFALNTYDKVNAKVGDINTTYTTITTPSDLYNFNLAGYCFFGNDDGSTTYKGCGSIEIQQIMVVEGEYTENDFPEYKKHNSQAVTIDLQGNELCSLANGTKDETDVTNGKVTLIKKTKEFTLDENKTMSASTLTNTTRFVIYNVASSSDDFLYAMSTHFYYMADYNADKEHFYIARNGAMYLFVNKSIASTVDELKTWLSKNNVKFLYELAEPETINLGTVEMPHTYDDVSYITNSADTEMAVKAYEWTDEITNDDNLQSIQIDSGCYTDGNIIGSVYVECLNANFVAETTNLVDKIIRCQIGVKYADLSTEYICKGKYIIERPNNEITAQMSQITAYSGLYTNLEAIYICNLDYSAGNITLKDVYIDVCKQLGLTPLKTDFLNSTIPITDNPFKNNEKNRVVLQTVSKIACSFVNVYEDNNQIDLCWLSENAEPDYTFEMSDYVSVEGGQVICGPINCLIIKNSQIDDENVTIKDDESIKANGEHSITISDDYILHNAELRQQAITSIWNRVKGLKYVDCKLITYYGKPFLKLGNKIRIYTSDTDYFDTYVLKHKFEYDGAFASTIESPALTEQEIKTKQDISLGKALANVQIDLDKQKERITSTVTTTNALQDSVSDLSEAVQEQESQMQTLSTALTQTNQSLQAEVKQISESLENGVSSLKNKLVTIDINGIAVSTSTSAIKAIMNNDRFAIKSGDTEAFYVGYDENLKKSVSRMNDLTITDYFTAGYHRQEKFEIDSEKRTGWFYVGGE